MGAIEKEGNLSQGALQAFGAGADLLLICHSHEKVIDAVTKTTAAIKKNPQLKARMNESIERVNIMRQRFSGSGL